MKTLTQLIVDAVVASQAFHDAIPAIPEPVAPVAELSVDDRAALNWLKVSWAEAGGTVTDPTTSVTLDPV